MQHLDVCWACRCHIRREERRCPFCAAQHEHRVTGVQRRVPRVSRARWAAFGSTLALMSCNDGSKGAVAIDAAMIDAIEVDRANDVGANPMLDAALDAGGAEDGRGDKDTSDAPRDSGESDETVNGDAGDLERDAPADTSVDAVADAAEDAREGGVGDALADVDRDARADAADAHADAALDAGPDAAYFACCPWAGNDPRVCPPQCDRRTEVCNMTTIPAPNSPPCVTIDAGTAGNLPELCMGPATCACIVPYAGPCGANPSRTWACQDDAGAVYLTCNGCYGAPPVRLDLTFARLIEPESSNASKRECA